MFLNKFINFFSKRHWRHRSKHCNAQKGSTIGKLKTLFKQRWLAHFLLTLF